jgi:hypothetical protein
MRTIDLNHVGWSTRDELIADVVDQEKHRDANKYPGNADMEVI